MHAPIFPVGCAALWFEPELKALTPAEQSWLLDQGSLTARLKNLSDSFEVKLIGQASLPIASHEHDFLNEHKPTMVREVLLYCDDEPWVFARSLIPEQLQKNAPAILKHLGNQPLGERLFRQPNLQRDSFQVAKFEQGSKVHELSLSLGYSAAFPLHGRRSRFIVGQEALLVQEVFLPSASLYKELF